MEVSAPPRGLELFAPQHRQTPLPPKRAEALEKLQIATVQDLLQHYPRRHIDRTRLTTIDQVTRRARAGILEEVQVHARVESVSPVRRIPKGGNRYGGGRRKDTVLVSGRIKDETGSLGVTWFNQQWVARALSKGTEAFFYGKPSLFRGRPQLTAPRFEVVRTGKEPFNVGRIIPIYPATADVTTDEIRKLMWSTLQSTELLDPLPEDLRARLRLCTRGEAIRLIHFPDTEDDVFRARRRLAFDEVFTLQLGLIYRKRKLERMVQGIEHARPGADSLAETFLAELPFEPTAAQRRACDEVAEDMVQSYPMHRLIEGEVGSGKTVVALYACLVAIEGGYQAAFMAPTEVLAEQHHLTLKELLDRAFGEAEGRNLFSVVSRRPVVRLITGSTPAAQRDVILREVAEGAVDLLIGTHALIQDAVQFRNLGVAIVDEQHRFGVHQRKSLRAKGMVGEPDILVMTATPIPRTLAVTIFGDLDVSVLDELPRGRQPVETKLVGGDDGRQRAYALIHREVAAGRQAFVVYALREDSSHVEVKSAKAEAVRLAEEVFPDLSVGLVHGDMKSADKEAAMTAFREGRTNVLVATTVIEVGVDIPNATVMVIEAADRFGLAQLHQLRGRIGRGAHKSYCLLVTDVEEDDTPALERLRAVEQTTDGFRLALVDLEQRGEGHLFGARQSGMPELKMTRVLRDKEVILEARALALHLLDEDPELRAYEHMALADEMRARFPEGQLDVVHSG